MIALMVIIYVIERERAARTKKNIERKGMRKPE
jgi:hypothetical protein